MRRISVDSVKKLHTKIIAETGGSDGVRDENLLDSAIESTFQTFGNIELYPTSYDKAAHLAYSLIKNHPFFDGNKRIGVTVMGLFLERNSVSFSCTNDELETLGLEIATGEISQPEIAEWIIEHLG
ncbi:MAG: type II toxin-antitoxin system death-on-curing family toxin [Treponemataceae bacterium]|nr:MAG: type II toxin-antitoxin system death-on-curing family toxin [Treponemataceae bacterium]